MIEKYQTCVHDLSPKRFGDQRYAGAEAVLVHQLIQRPDASMPITGKRILVTRAAGQASQLAELLESVGAIPILVPSIEIAPPSSYTALDEALLHLESFDWIVFTSKNAVDVFRDRKKTGKNTQKIPLIAAIGSATAEAAKAAGLDVELVPVRFVAEALAEALIPLAAGGSILLVRAEEARDILPEMLINAGAAVTIAPAYRNQIPESSIARAREIFALPDATPNAITFTSGSTARNLAALLESAGVCMPPYVLLASIGPITSQAMRELGYEPAIEARKATIPALVEALVAHFNSHG